MRVAMHARQDLHIISYCRRLVITNNYALCSERRCMVVYNTTHSSDGAVWGTADAAPPPFRPSDPGLCGSHPLVTPYQCRLEDLLISILYLKYTL